MTDWKALTHAYGKANEIPALIEKLRTSPSDTIWQDLWSCLCHQGTVYSASYAALLPLCELAKALPPSERLSPLTLIGAIIASDDVFGMDGRPVESIQALIPDLQRLIGESMRTRGLDPETFVYYLQAAGAFAGYLFWGRHLSHLTDGEFPGRCPACQHELFLAIGIHGFFVADQEWARPQDARSRRNPISPAEQNDLSDGAAWLHATALSCDQPQVASWIRYIFGTTVCPACDRSLKVADAITEVYPERQNVGK